MTIRRRLAGLGLALALGGALAGAGRMTAPSPGALRFRLNLDRWQSCTEAQRDEYRARWREWLVRSPEQQARALRRYGVLSRLRDQVQLSGSGDASPARLAAELTLELEELILQLRREAPDAPSDLGLAESVDRLFRRRAAAFLDHMAARGRITSSERDRLLALPATALADESLRRLKAESLLLVDSAVAERLAAAEPLDVVAGLDALRRETGFLGRAGQIWPLSADEREELAGLPSPELVREALLRMKAVAIRDRLQGHPLAATEVDALLALPWAELERSLHALLAGA